MTKEDMILEELRELRKDVQVVSKDVAVLQHVTASLDELKTDMAVMKSKHDTGNKSERISAGVAILALLVSIVVAASSCKEKQNAQEANGRIPIPFNTSRPGR